MCQLLFPALHTQTTTSTRRTLSTKGPQLSASWSAKEGSSNVLCFFKWKYCQF